MSSPSTLARRLLRTGGRRRDRAAVQVLSDIRSIEASLAAVDDATVTERARAVRDRLAGLPADALAEALDHELVEVFALASEAAWRTLGQRPYDVQILGALALHGGAVAEMRTGEGKTLVATLPVSLHALAGRGVHVVTANPYLARRDAETMGPLYALLGLSCGVVTAEIDDVAAKQAAYACDITYGTATEFGFDYLRDNLVTNFVEKVQRGHFSALIDEADSLLIDEARTPLVISGATRRDPRAYQRFAQVASVLVPGQDYEVDEAHRRVFLTDDGLVRAEELLDIEDLHGHDHFVEVHLLANAITAWGLMVKDRDYVVADGEVRIVDEHTGRTLTGRQWSNGLHQAVEAKEGVRINAENATQATITIQGYFRLYDRLAGMSGTAMTEEEEFSHTYGLAVVEIPTHLPSARVDHPDVFFRTEDDKLAALLADVTERHRAGQPVLVGTPSVEKSEQVSKLFANAGVPHAVLNAKAHDAEAAVIAQAGRPGAVTVATNMAGRGVDILLGGAPVALAAADTDAVIAAAAELGCDPDPDELAGITPYWQKRCARDGDVVRDLGGLYVVGTERHDARRIDDQLRGRAGRQGDPGESRFYLSLEDHIVTVFAAQGAGRLLAATVPDQGALESRAVAKLVRRAQEAVEGINAAARADVLKYDEVLDTQRRTVYAYRDQVLTGDGLDEVLRDALEDAVRTLANDRADAWYLDDTEALDALVADVTGLTGAAPDRDALAGARDDHGAAAVLDEHLARCWARRREELGDEIFDTVARRIALDVLDRHWQRHLEEMASLNDGIGLRGLGQTSPLAAWSREGFALFSEMLTAARVEAARHLLTATITVNA